MVYSIGFTTLPKLTIQISSNIILVVKYCIKHIRAASLWNHPLHQLNPYITQSLNPNEYHVAKQHVKPPYFMVKPCYTVIPRVYPCKSPWNPYNSRLSHHEMWNPPVKSRLLLHHQLDQLVDLRLVPGLDGRWLKSDSLPNKNVDFTKKRVSLTNQN